MLCDRLCFFSQKGYGGSFSSLMTMVGIFFMSISFTYKTKEIELKLHSLIQNRAKEFSGKAFFVVIAYLVYSKILKQEYFGRSE